MASKPLTDYLVQPYRLHETIVVEKRDKDGNLDFSAPQPPKMLMKFDEVYTLMFKDRPELNSAGWVDLEKWLNERGWKLRAKTW